MDPVENKRATTTLNPCQDMDDGWAEWENEGVEDKGIESAAPAISPYLKHLPLQTDQLLFLDLVHRTRSTMKLVSGRQPQESLLTRILQDENDDLDSINIQPHLLNAIDSLEFELIDLRAQLQDLEIFLYKEDIMNYRRIKRRPLGQLMVLDRIKERVLDPASGILEDWETSPVAWVQDQTFLGTYFHQFKSSLESVLNAFINEKDRVMQLYLAFLQEEVYPALAVLFQRELTWTGTDEWDLLLNEREDGAEEGSILVGWFDEGCGESENKQGW